MAALVKTSGSLLRTCAAYLGIFADFLIDSVEGRGLKIKQVCWDLGNILLIQIPAQALDLLQAPRLQRTTMLQTPWLI